MTPLDPPTSLWVNLVARLCGWLLRPKSLPPIDPKALRRVLVVRPDDRVGNALLTIPLVRVLQKLLPHAQVDLLLAKKRAATARGLPDLRVVEFDKRLLFANPFRFARWLRDLRSYDAAIDASHWHSFSLTAALLARWASRGAMISIDRGPARHLASNVVSLPVKDEPDAISKLQLVAGLGLQPPIDAPPLETALGHSAHPPGRYAVINPGARKEDHRWPAESFGALAKTLREKHGIPCIVAWGPSERGLALRVRVASEGTAELAPPTDLEELASLFRGAALVVTNDTGPMHLAVACGAPVLAIQLSADAIRWSHPGPRFAGVRGDDPEALRAALDAAGRLLALTPQGPPADLAPGWKEEAR